MITRHRIDSAVSQCRSHDRDISSAHVQRALRRIGVHHVERIEVDAAVALEQSGDGLIALIGEHLGVIDLAVEREFASSESGEPAVRIRSHCSAGVALGTSAVVASAPALTIGFIG